MLSAELREAPAGSDSDPRLEPLDADGVDRAQIRALLAHTMRERLRTHDEALRWIQRLEARSRRG